MTLAVILVAYAMIVIDASVVITALPQLRDTLGMTESGLSWVQNAYLLAYGGLLLVGGRAGDLVGRRRMFVAGVAAFTAASLAVGIAPSAPWLLAARAAQGLGAAILAPSALALLHANFREGAERTRAVSYFSMAGVGAMLGLVVGGVVTAWLSWRVGFLVNVPIGVALIALARRHVAETARHTRRLDLLGATTSTLGMAALVYGLVEAVASAIVAGAALLALFVAGQTCAMQPIVPLRLFASRTRAGAYLARLLFAGAVAGFLFFTTLHLQHGRALSPFATGLAFVPMMLANFFGALAVPRLARRFAMDRILAAATATALIGMAWLSTLSPDAPFLTSIELPMLLIGAGGGASIAPLTASGIAGVAAEDAGAAAGLVTVAHQLGGSLGLGILLGIAGSVERVGTALAGASVMLALALVVVVALVID